MRQIGFAAIVCAAMALAASGAQTQQPPPDADSPGPDSRISSNGGDTNR